MFIGLVFVDYLKKLEEYGLFIDDRFAYLAYFLFIGAIYFIIIMKGTM